MLFLSVLERESGKEFCKLFWISVKRLCILLMDVLFGCTVLELIDKSFVDVVDVDDGWLLEE